MVRDKNQCHYYEVHCTWDPAKARSNATKHGVTFEEARSVFDDPHIRIEVQRHVDEVRMAATGYSSLTRVLFVVFVEVSYETEEIRIVSARKATRAERKAYEEVEDGGEC